MTAETPASRQVPHISWYSPVCLEGRAQLANRPSWPVRPCLQSPVLVPQGDLPMNREARLEPPAISTQPLVQLQGGSELPPLAQCAFPDDRDSPAGFEQVASVALVPFHVGKELGTPELLAGGWRGRVRAPGMSVPEAAVHEAHGSESGKHQIGGAGELAVVQAVSETVCVESPAENEFGYRQGYEDLCPVWMPEEGAGLVHPHHRVDRRTP